MQKEYVGIIIGSLVYGGIKKGIRYYENLEYYEIGGKTNHLIPCFFRLKDILPGESEVKAWVKRENGKYEIKTIPKPLVIHNRGLINTVEAKKKIKKLQEEGIMIFNECNRYTKLTIHNILDKDKEILPHLPETMQLNKENLITMIGKFDDLIIKPNSGSLGSNVVKLTKMQNGNWELHYQEKKVWHREVFSSEWPEKLKTILENPRYIIQRRIPLALYQGSPFDLRVSVQRNGQGKWQVSGIVGKVAQQGLFLTNVARGGSCHGLAMLLSDLPHLQYEKVYEDIVKMSIKVAERLSKKLPNLADIGIDVGITNEGFPMFIESNGRDLRVTFRNAKLMKEWEATHTTPLSYARYLLNLKNRA